MISQKLRSYTEITMNDIDLTQMSDIIVNVKQKPDFEVDVTPAVTDVHTLVFELSKTDAARLTNKPVTVQVLYVDANGVPHASAIKSVPVQEVQRSEAYGD